MLDLTWVIPALPLAGFLVLLVVAVVGAVVLARTAKGAQIDEDEPVPSLPGDPAVDVEADEEVAS